MVFTMAEADFPSRSLDRIMIRLPSGMRDRLALAAKENKRSVNAEVVDRLESSFAASEAFRGHEGAVVSMLVNGLQAMLKNDPKDKDARAVGQRILEITNAKSK